MTGTGRTTCSAMALRVVLISSLACATTREDAKAKVEEAIGNALELQLLFNDVFTVV